ncbi:hypothetical protein P691DRAFT_621014, partial [Macrolepiota fuliginosa MF-IS2]
LATLSPVHSAPLRERDGGDFVKQNGLDAQNQNAQFATMKATDSCQDGSNACVTGSFAQCVGGKWMLQPCSGDLKCFALPLVNKAGTSLACDTEADANARIATALGTGATSGGAASSAP